VVDPGYAFALLRSGVSGVPMSRCFCEIWEGRDFPIQICRSDGEVGSQVSQKRRDLGVVDQFGLLDFFLGVVIPKPGAVQPGEGSRVGSFSGQVAVLHARSLAKLGMTPVGVKLTPLPTCGTRYIGISPGAGRELTHRSGADGVSCHDARHDGPCGEQPASTVSSLAPKLQKPEPKRSELIAGKQ
jgi:hypothetical protein